MHKVSQVSTSLAPKYFSLMLNEGVRVETIHTVACVSIQDIQRYFTYMISPFHSLWDLLETIQLDRTMIWTQNITSYMNRISGQIWRSLIEINDKTYKNVK